MRRSFRNGENTDTEDLITNAWRNWHDETAENLIDPALRDSSGFPQNILRCIHIGLLCVQSNAATRPTMDYVGRMLNSVSTLPVPTEPEIYVSSARESNSHNDVSSTEFYTR